MDLGSFTLQYRITPHNTRERFRTIASQALQKFFRETLAKRGEQAPSQEGGATTCMAIPEGANR